MPIYEYRCRKGHTFEVLQSMSDDPVAVCAECRAPVERVFHPVAVHFKGSGFYTTDYGRGRSGGGDSGSGGDSAKKDSKESPSDAGKSESKETAGAKGKGSDSSGGSGGTGSDSSGGSGSDSSG